MFNVDITGYFPTATPSSITVSSRVFDSAVDFYKARLRARIVPPKRRGLAVLESSYGFQIKIRSSSSMTSSSSSVQLKVPRKAHRMEISLALGYETSSSSGRTVKRVTDAYGVAWVIS